MSWEEDYLMAKVAELDARLAEVEKRTAVPAPDTETGSEYGSWSFADLRTEAKRRGLNAEARPPSWPRGCVRTTGRSCELLPARRHLPGGPAGAAGRGGGRPHGVPQRRPAPPAGSGWRAVLQLRRVAAGWSVRGGRSGLTCAVRQTTSLVSYNFTPPPIPGIEKSLGQKARRRNWVPSDTPVAIHRRWTSPGTP